MAEHNEIRAGVYSGLFAVIMVVALSVMAMMALEPPRAAPLHASEIDLSLPEVPLQDLPRPTLDSM